MGEFLVYGYNEDNRISYLGIFDKLYDAITLAKRLQKVHGRCVVLRRVNKYETVFDTGLMF